MNISDLLHHKNNMKLEDLIPLKEFKTQIDLESKLESFKGGERVLNNEEKFNVFKTEDEIKELFKELGVNINLNNIYYNKKDSLLGNSVLYIDKENFIAIDITNQLLLSYQKKIADYFESILDLINELEDNARNNKFSRSFDFMPEAFRMEMLNSLIESKEVITDDLYKLFMETYSRTDYGFNFIKVNTLKKLYNSKSENLKYATNKALSNLPETITVYRGQADKSTNYAKAFSWTLDPKIAMFFSLRLIQQKGAIVTAKVKKEDILEYLDTEEKEVLILPEKVFDVNIESFYPLSYVSELMESFVDIYTRYRYLLNVLDFEHDTDGHGKLHSLRVLLHSLTLGTIKDLSDEDLDILSMASIYHDTGRVHDEECEMHGRRSSVIYKANNFKRDEIVEFLIEYHCIDDEVALDYLDSSDIKDKEKAKLLFSIFKDADALDRLRFGLKDLDIRYLRNEESIKLLLFAHLAVKGIKL